MASAPQRSEACLPDGQSRLVVIFGPPGSGKSTLAQALAPRLGAALLNSDDITAPLFGDDRDSAAYLALRPKLYAALYGLAETNLKLGLSVVVDAPHGAVLHDRSWHDRLDGLARRTESPLCLIGCACPPATLRSRLIQRGEGRDAGKLAGWDCFLAGQPDWSTPAFPHVALDTTRPLQAVVHDALIYILAQQR